MALFLGNTISEPMRFIFKTAEAIDKEDFELVKEINDSVTKKENVNLEQDDSILTKTYNTQTDIGQLLHIFMQMVRGFITREENLKKQVEELNLKLEVDENKKIDAVNKLTDNEEFENIKSKVDMFKEEFKKC